MRNLPLPALLCALIPLAASPAAAKPREVPVATPAGKPESCINRSRIRETQVRSDSIIDFYMRGGQIYRNTLPNSCPSLGFEQRFAYTTTIDQLCSVDSITVLYTSPGMRGASCGLGQFQPVTIPKRTKR